MPLVYFLGLSWLKDWNIVLPTEDKMNAWLILVYLCLFSRKKQKSPNTEIRIVTSIQFSHSVMSNSLQPHGLQHARPHCPSPTPRACSNSCPLNWWCHPTITFSVIPFSSCLQTFQHQGLFQWVTFLHHMAKVLGVLVSTSAFRWIFRTDFL